MEYKSCYILACFRILTNLPVGDIPIWEATIC